MPTITWTDVGTLSLTDELMTGPWVKVAETLGDATLLRITADGRWSPLGPWTAECDPNGIGAIQVVAGQLMLPEAPLGALIAKIGGSSVTLAGWPSAAPAAGATATATGADGKPFAVGTLCILPLPRVVLGPVFVGINSVMRPVRVTSLNVTVSTAAPT